MEAQFEEEAVAADRWFGWNVCALSSWPRSVHCSQECRWRAATSGGRSFPLAVCRRASPGGRLRRPVTSPG
jgi:hypothetical protein